MGTLWLYNIPWPVSGLRINPGPDHPAPLKLSATSSSSHRPTSRHDRTTNRPTVHTPSSFILLDLQQLLPMNSGHTHFNNRCRDTRQQQGTTLLSISQDHFESFKNGLFVVDWIIAGYDIQHPKHKARRGAASGQHKYSNFIPFKSLLAGRKAICHGITSQVTPQIS